MDNREARRINRIALHHAHGQYSFDTSPRHPLKQESLKSCSYVSRHARNSGPEGKSSCTRWSKAPRVRKSVYMRQESDALQATRPTSRTVCSQSEYGCVESTGGGGNGWKCVERLRSIRCGALWIENCGLDPYFCRRLDGCRSDSVLPEEISEVRRGARSGQGRSPIHHGSLCLMPRGQSQVESAGTGYEHNYQWTHVFQIGAFQ